MTVPGWWKDRSVLITGGTGTFGQAMVRRLMADGCPRIVVYSRDERKQLEMRDAGLAGEQLRYFVGDVRDRERIRRALPGVNVVIHAAAMKQVAACEYNPGEAAATNVGGAQAVIEACLDEGIDRVVALSSDKAVHPANLYGATKLVAERLFVHANAYGGYGTKFSCVRYGNVIGSRGSIVDKVIAGLPFTVPSSDVTRFWTTPTFAVQFVLNAVSDMEGGEIYVPALLGARVVDVVEAARSFSRAGAQRAPLTVPLTHGEKRHETLVSRDELDQIHNREAHRFTLRPTQPRQDVTSPLAREYRSDQVNQIDKRELCLMIHDAISARGNPPGEVRC